jgi:site-specific DNA recombinase
MPTPRQRAAIYRRVSTARQVNGASLEQQEEACRAHAAAQGWDVVTLYSEMGRSAYAEDLKRRPAFQQMIADAEKRRFDVVLVYELSRFGRRRKAFAVGEDLERLGIRLVSVTEQFDVSTVEGFVTYSILAMQAELHSRMLARRISAVRERERDAGRPAKRAALGQRWVGGDLVWNDADAVLPRRAYALAAQGLGTNAQLAQLAAEGHTISRSSLHYILTNPAYAGLQRHRGALTATAWPGLIAREEWERVQALRAGRRPGTAVRATVRSHNDTLLAGLACCANCGAKLHYEHHKAGRCYYRCAGRHNGSHCDARPSRADTLDAQISELVLRFVIPDEVIARAQDLLHQRAQSAPATPDPAAIGEQLRRLGRAYADGALDDAEYERRRDALRQQLQAVTPAPSIDLGPTIRLISSLPHLWAATPTPQRRSLLAQLISQVYARRHVIYAVRPTPTAGALLAAIWQTRAMSTSQRQGRHSPIVLLAA